jgi:hypothetical protein
MEACGGGCPVGTVARPLRSGKAWDALGKPYAHLRANYHQAGAALKLEHDLRCELQNTRIERALCLPKPWRDHKLLIWKRPAHIVQGVADIREIGAIENVESLRDEL